MQRHLKTADVERRRKERCPRGSFICTCVYLYGNVQDELESQNTLLLAENILLTALFFFALGGFHCPSMRSTIILSFVFHLPRVEILPQSLPGLAGTFASLFFFLLPFQAGAAGQLWVRPASQRETSGTHRTHELGESGQLEGIRGPQLLLWDLTHLIPELTYCHTQDQWPGPKDKKSPIWLSWNAFLWDPSKLWWLKLCSQDFIGRKQKSVNYTIKKGCWVKQSV